MLDLLQSTGLMPHGYCLSWKPWLVALQAGSDALIFISYSVIPIAIVLFLRQRPDVRFGGIGVLFAAFIMLCGLTHLMGLTTLWVPIYEIEAAVKLATGLISAATAVILFVLMPKLVALPSPAQLEDANAELRAEIAAHRATLAELERIRAGLEREVETRTRDLTASNERLGVVTRETVHRAKNLLTVVQSIARQTGQHAETKEELVEVLHGRLASLDRALSSVSEAERAGADLGELIETQLEHYRDSYPERLSVEGPPMRVRAEAAQQIGLAIHELATNAVKYGALSGPSGRVEVRWEDEGAGDEAMMRLTWNESGGAAPPERRPAAMAGTGFGSLLLNRAVPRQLRGSAHAETTEDSYSYVLTAPVSELRPRSGPAPADRIAEAYG